MTIHEEAGTARFLDAHTIESETAPLLYGDKVIICTGGTSRRLPVPGVSLSHAAGYAAALAWLPAHPPGSPT